MMEQFWTWNYFVASALLAGAGQVALGVLDLWVYPDARPARVGQPLDNRRP